MELAGPSSTWVRAAPLSPGPEQALPVPGACACCLEQAGRPGAWGPLLLLPLSGGHGPGDAAVRSCGDPAGDRSRDRWRVLSSGAHLPLGGHFPPLPEGSRPPRLLCSVSLSLVCCPELVIHRSVVSQDWLLPVPVPFCVCSWEGRSVTPWPQPSRTYLPGPALGSGIRDEPCSPSLRREKNC